jgi:hypothetical protein
MTAAMEMATNAKINLPFLVLNLPDSAPGFDTLEFFNFFPVSNHLLDI